MPDLIKRFYNIRYKVCRTDQININDKLVFCDMAIYTTVKNNTFNGINLPSIAVLRQNGKIETLCEFGYTHFAQRLGNEKLYHEL